MLELFFFADEALRAPPPLQASTLMLLPLNSRYLRRNAHKTRRSRSACCAQGSTTVSALDAPTDRALWTYLLRHGHVNGQLHACHESALVVALNLLVVTSHALKRSEMKASTPQ